MMKYSLIEGCNDSIILDGVTTIEKHSFMECTEMESIIIPTNVTTIIIKLSMLGHLHKLYIWSMLVVVH